MIEIDRHIIRVGQQVNVALDKLNHFSAQKQTLFVINERSELVGSVTDGDIRRGLVNGHTLESKVEEVMFVEPLKIGKSENIDEFVFRINRNEKKLLPVVDESNVIVEIIDLINYKRKLPIDAFIMAGGKGTRLKPLTDNTPKPLLVVGDKPILEHNIDHLKSAGVEKFHISLAYKGEQIEEYFGDGENKAIDIKYVNENEPLGTAGALTLNKDYSNDYLLLMNSDLLTDFDIDKMFEFFMENNSDMVVATIPYEVEIPYGVVETDDRRVIDLIEKPKYTYQSNAGIYLLKKEVIEYIPKNSPFNATDLIESLIKDKKVVMNYPLYCYWLDIGNPADYQKAQKDIQNLDL